MVGREGGLSVACRPLRPRSPGSSLHTSPWSGPLFPQWPGQSPGCRSISTLRGAGSLISTAQRAKPLSQLPILHPQEAGRKVGGRVLSSAHLVPYRFPENSACSIKSPAAMSRCITSLVTK